MAKTKKRPQIKDAKKTDGMSPASKLAHMEFAEEVLAGDEAAEETVEETVMPEEAPSADAEKAEMQAILMRLMDDMGAESLTALSEMIDKAEMQKLIRVHGLDEEAAKLFLEQQEKVRALRAAEKAAMREAVYAEMRGDKRYEGIDARKDAIEAFIFRTGLSPKEAYNALFAEERMEAMLREMEDMKSAAEKKAKNIPALTGGDAPDAERFEKLSEAEKWAAARAGMTPTEYAKFKYAY